MATKTETGGDKDDGKIRCGAPRQNSTTACRQIVKYEGQRCFHHRTHDKPHLETVFPSLELPLFRLSTGLISDEANRLVTVRVNKARTRVKDDRPGWIYVYYLPDDDDPWYWKIGCTAEANPDDRINSWPGAKKRFVARTKANKLCEGIIHAVLHDFRLYRYVYQTKGGERVSGKRYITTQASNGAILRDATWGEVRAMAAITDASLLLPFTESIRDQLVADVEQPKFYGRKKEVEWFQLPIEDVQYVVLSVVSAVDQWIDAAAAAAQ